VALGVGHARSEVAPARTAHHGAPIRNRSCCPGSRRGSGAAVTCPAYRVGWNQPPRDGVGSSRFTAFSVSRGVGVAGTARSGRWSGPGALAGLACVLAGVGFAGLSGGEDVGGQGDAGTAGGDAGPVDQLAGVAGLPAEGATAGGGRSAFPPAGAFGRVDADAPRAAHRELAGEGGDDAGGGNGTRGPPKQEPPTKRVRAECLRAAAGVGASGRTMRRTFRWRRGCRDGEPTR
jgi:hypothetical protein